MEGGVLSDNCPELPKGISQRWSPSSVWLVTIPIVKITHLVFVFFLLELLFELDKMLF